MVNRGPCSSLTETQVASRRGGACWRRTPASAGLVTTVVAWEGVSGGSVRAVAASLLTDPLVHHVDQGAKPLVDAAVEVFVLSAGSLVFFLGPLVFFSVPPLPFLVLFVLLGKPLDDIGQLDYLLCQPDLRSLIDSRII